MNKKGPIVIIEDDEDDQEMLTEIFQKLGYENEIVFFRDGNEALEYLDKTDLHPFSDPFRYQYAKDQRIRVEEENI